MRKVRNAHTERLPRYHEWNTNGRNYYSYANVSFGSDIIEYDDGRRSPNGHWPWKACHHVTSGIITPICGTSYAAGTWNGSFWKGVEANYIASLPNVSLPSGSFDRGALAGLLNQLDLNRGESVLLYSGVLQAVPLLGSVATFTKVLNRAAKNLSKSFRKKPFTTVLKSLISADFVNRFVIQPTLDDCRKFQDACDYVLRTLQTARERSASRFALSTDLTSVVSQSSRSVTVSGGLGSVPGMVATETKRQVVSSKAFALLEAKYDIGAIDPIKLWARRTGLTRPLDSVWDLVPFSFVVDYFTRAGDFISALSDEMSDQEGLRGKITNIIDVWCTFSKLGECVVRGTNLVNTYAQHDYWYGKCTQLNEGSNPGEAIRRNSDFRRYRLPNPWYELSSLQETISDYLTVNLDISSTRKRTIAELVIQAKL